MTMTANGADTQTRQEMQQVLGGDSLEELNVELKQFLTDLYTEQILSGLKIQRENLR